MFAQLAVTMMIALSLVLASAAVGVIAVKNRVTVAVFWLFGVVGILVAGIAIITAVFPP